MSKIRFASEEYVDSKLAGAATVQPDWAQNDAAASDYVKNRTHWVEGGNGSAEILHDGDVWFSRVGMSGNAPLNANAIDGGFDLSAAIPEAVKLTLIIDSVTEWSGIVNYDENEYFHVSDIGNIFSFDCYKNDTYIYLTLNNPNQLKERTAHVKVQIEEVETVHTLDEKYIPDTIARKTDLEAAINAAIGNAIGGSY